MTALASLHEDHARWFCSARAKQLGVDPLGTAPMYDEFFMIEFELPWHRDVTATDGFPEDVARAAEEAKQAGRRLQLQAVAPDLTRSEDGRVRMMHFVRSAPEPAVAPFRRQEYVAPKEAAPALVRFLLFGEGDPAAFQPWEVTGNFRDVFVCTHGARDACCGRFGAALYLELDAAAQSRGGEAEGPELRVWRVNHIGGHRFAPTLIDMPSGRYWGGLPSSALAEFMEGPEELDGLRPYLRGWTGLRSPAEQVAEGEAWRRFGRVWNRWERTVRTEAVETDPERAVVALTWRDPATGRGGEATAVVAVNDVVVLPESCGKEEVPSKQWTVAAWEEGPSASFGSESVVSSG